MNHGKCEKHERPGSLKGDTKITKIAKDTKALLWRAANPKAFA